MFREHYNSTRVRMTPTAAASTRRSFAGMAVLLALLVIRLPSLVEPAGADQSLYTYVGERILAGDVPYRDAWDQKPPGIHAVYAVIWGVWPSDAAIGAADLLAAAAVAWLLVVLGRRTFGVGIGYAAAAMFLLLGNPAIQRLGGVRVRSQCETFIAVAITGALVLLSGTGKRRWLWAGVCLGVAFWLKYNAIVYAAPLVLAGLALGAEGRTHDRSRAAAWLTQGCAGFAAVAVVVVGYFAMHGALTDLWLATITYNLQYSQETYRGLGGLLGYFSFPLERAHLDLLWYLGGVGAVVLALLSRLKPMALMVIAWIAASCASIAINGARDLPQYFVQAHPALALAAAAGLAPLVRRGAPLPLRFALLAVVLAGVWKVGDESTLVRAGGLPEIVRNVQIDLDYARGRSSREAFLGRFQIPQEVKYVPLAAERLAARVRETTQPTDRILVFGFASSVYVHGARASASRFFWSRPVAVEFGAPRPGYGSAGLLADLERTRPALVALQKHWGTGAPEPMDFFLAQPALKTWLERGYTLEDDGPDFAVWRRVMKNAEAIGAEASRPPGRPAAAGRVSAWGWGPTRN